MITVICLALRADGPAYAQLMKRSCRDCGRRRPRRSSPPRRVRHRPSRTQMAEDPRNFARHRTVPTRACRRRSSPHDAETVRDHHRPGLPPRNVIMLTGDNATRTGVQVRRGVAWQPGRGFAPVRLLLGARRRTPNRKASKAVDGDQFHRAPPIRSGSSMPRWGVPSRGCLSSSTPASVRRACPPSGARPGGKVDMGMPASANLTVLAAASGDGSLVLVPRATACSPTSS